MRGFGRWSELGSFEPAGSVFGRDGRRDDPSMTGCFAAAAKTICFIVTPGAARGRRLSNERGYALIELIIVMMLLLVVISAVTDGFASATYAEADQTARVSDQQAAREALERMRKDIHCASGASTQQIVDPVTGVGTGNYILNLTVTAGTCLGVTDSSSGVQWCTSSVGGSATRYQLFRTTSGTCNGSNALFELDYVTQASLWSLPTCPSGRLQTVAVDIPVNRDIARRPGRTYELQDSISLRNSLPCP
jgi:prepilin-type N-terminal cleavage/methylation domain-containing protein